MKLGINTYTYMWSIGFQGPNPAYPARVVRPANPLTALGLLEKAHGFGLHLLQTGPNLDISLLPEVELAEFIQKAGVWGIQLELGTRGLDLDHLVSQVALAKRLGASLIRTLPEIGRKYVTEARLILPAIREILPMLEKESIQLAIENGRIPAADLRAALDTLGSPWVGVVLDMVNSMAVPEGWREVTRWLAPHTMCVHFKDFTIQRVWHMMGFLCEGRPSGKGMIDILWLLQQLRESPYDYNIILELWPPEQKTLEETINLEQAWAVESIAYLRQFVRD